MRVLRERNVASVNEEFLVQGGPVKGSGDLDIVLRNGNVLEVGGPDKARDLGEFGSQMAKLRAYADAEGVEAFFLYDVATPQEAIDLAERWLGQGHALPLPPP